ncbi:hypothetical protein JOC37_001057 [Desulfohalotomaculum tongense]|uniref:DUF2953 domain-containing protein n=1 Tax=Desulforadius tongensis TaxID=1216062 RepID=UPI00195D99E2|nr:DUF2953 domain-containing protein [Desulforadius tongensis]MBM7854679.1 hypothetical protein [Desulforadius tongensis]
MQLLLIIVLLIILLLGTFTLIPLRIRIRYRQKNLDNLITVEMRLWKLPPFKLETPVIDLQTKMSGLELKIRSSTQNSGAAVRKIVTTLLSIPHEKDDVADADKNLKIPFNWKKIQHKINRQKKSYHRYWPIIKYLLSHVHCRYLKWYTKFGMGDAAVTGVTTGLAWAGKTVLLSRLFKIINPPPRHPQLEIHPNFNNNELIMDIDCIFEVRIGYIMVTGTKILLAKR